jgi:hypothetical protein
MIRGAGRDPAHGLPRATADAVLARGVLTCALVAVGTLGAVQTAHAEDAPPAPLDVVVLHGGRALQGRLLESRPGTMVRIRDEHGQVWTVPWSQVDRIGTGCATPAPTADVGSRVWVHVESQVPVALQESAPRGWRTVCTAPCDAWLPRDGSYRFDGPGARPTSAISLQDMGTCADVRFSAASPAWFATGVGLTVVGSAAMVAGVYLYVFGGLSVENGGGTGPENAGIATFVLGAGVLAFGIVATAKNYHSDLVVTGERGNEQEAGADWLRAASFRETPAIERALPVPRLFPVFQASF